MPKNIKDKRKRQNKISLEPKSVKNKRKRQEKISLEPDATKAETITLIQKQGRRKCPCDICTPSLYEETYSSPLISFIPRETNQYNARVYRVPELKRKEVYDPMQVARRAISSFHLRPKTILNDTQLAAIARFHEYMHEWGHLLDAEDASQCVSTERMISLTKVFSEIFLLSSLKNVTFKWSTSLGSDDYFAECKFPKPGKVIIIMHPTAWDVTAWDAETFEPRKQDRISTVLHEALHGLAGYSADDESCAYSQSLGQDGHGRAWQLVAEKIELSAPFLLGMKVFQERILSRRTIFYTEEGFYWECDGLASSESGPEAKIKEGNSLAPRLDYLVKQWRVKIREEQFVENGKLGTKRTDLGRSIARWTTNLYTKKREVSGRPWSQIIDAFTTRDLTYPNDRLPAVTGIGKALANLTKDTYLGYGGLFMSDIVGGLSWYRDWKHSATSLTVAPLWSWASINGPVTHMYSRTNHVTDVARVTAIGTTTTFASPTHYQVRPSGPLCWIWVCGTHNETVHPATNFSHEFNSLPPKREVKSYPMKTATSSVYRRLYSGAKRARGIQGSGPRQMETDNPLSSTVNLDHFIIDFNEHEVIFDTEVQIPAAGRAFRCIAMVNAGFLKGWARAFPMAMIVEPADGSEEVWKRVGWAFLWADVPDENVEMGEVVVV
ncbi:hypothetical protein EJ04DRAFT_573540 [Polyplosphaeria fusca]|uniref:Uncharacterized protein n=1 Tax=Polyplosphaeria fusca TaxID=682080 RepID=A0A9P4R8I3_9PLEO|nr:hypothetical protein EJ04DRAFT_573540 [Polyplosphaeria fusca]